MQFFTKKRAKKDKVFESLSKNIQNLKVFEKGQVIICDYCMQKTARIGPDYLALE